MGPIEKLMYGFTWVYIRLNLCLCMTNLKVEEE